MSIERDNVLFLLGAGCSANAGIPVSGQMVDNVHYLVTTDSHWQPYRDLYYYLRSSIQFADGIFGNFHSVFNIEKLLIVMAEIEKKERNPVYPFIGAWDNRLLDLAGTNFHRVTELRELITQELVTHWVKPSAYREAAYYDGFKTLAFGNFGLGFNVKVFSLNYDLCFEKRVGKENIELGFDEHTSEWSYHNFARADDKSYTLYKLHGSLDWYIDSATQKLMPSDDTARDPALIFGVSNKLRAIDPYLFYIYEFRRHCFSPDLRLLVCIGYSFADDHINDIIAQAIKNNSQARVLATMYSNRPEDQLVIRNALRLTPESEQIIFEKTDAKHFLADTLSTEYLEHQFISVQDSPFAS